jgi:septum formation protein
LTLRGRLGTPGPVPEADASILVLASASPRRRELLERAGIAFETVPAQVAEDALPGEAPRAQAERLAHAKAVEVARRLGPRPRRFVLGADTLVVLDGEGLGKPRDPEHAAKLLARLVGRSHRVITAVALVATDTLEARTRAVESTVVMRAADEDELRAYVAGGEPLDKAGAYAAQGAGRHLIERIEGSESNVIGLPLEETRALLREAGAEPGTS